jgi:hypothetical protein
VSFVYQAADAALDWQWDKLFLWSIRESCDSNARCNGGEIDGDQLHLLYKYIRLTFNRAAVRYLPSLNSNDDP